MEVTIGGDRLGSGNKQKQEMHNYNRATFNQEQDWKSTMAPGILYPFLCIPMTNGDSMDIDLDALVMTLPTKGPLMGSFKLQADVFSVPMRLYNGVLHNNPLDIGLKMNQIYMPKLLTSYYPGAWKVKGSSEYTWQVNNTSLLKYLGLSGIGTKDSHDLEHEYISRKINAIPVLGYYDIFKQYYANKQEENAYVITPGEITDSNNAEINIIDMSIWSSPTDTPIVTTLTYSNKIWSGTTGESAYALNFTILGNNLDIDKIAMRVNSGEWKTIKELYEDEDITYQLTNDKTGLVIGANFLIDDQYTVEFKKAEIEVLTANIKLEPFKLKNIDLMRESILSKAQIGYEYVIGNNGDWDDESGADTTGLPYSALFMHKGTAESGYISYNSFIENGLVVKTYQSDIFNNWIETDWIEGENGIAALSAVNVSEGSLEMDALNLAQKVYNMLNRVAISGGTYEDWQEAVFTQEAVRKAESPIYEGGMAAEIFFEQVISSSETDVRNDFQALGTLGGRGTLGQKRGGHDIHIRAKEPVFVMGIVSITPRICYTQGNEWYLTELNSFDDLHKPALDGIGFQDLIAEQMLWTDTVVAYNGLVVSRRSAGKVVAWSNYMTAVDKAFGDFAEPEGKGFMVLSRNYEKDSDGSIADMTTYIDPAKFNYAFAYTTLAAQNFWVQIHSNVKTRRVMSAHQIPNL